MGVFTSGITGDASSQKLGGRSRSSCSAVREISGRWDSVHQECRDSGANLGSRKIVAKPTRTISTTPFRSELGSDCSIASAASGGWRGSAREQ